jgi:protein phosphatase
MNLFNLFRPSPKKERVQVAVECRPQAEGGPSAPLAVASFGLTDRGQARASNEDCFAVVELARTLRVHQTNLPHAGTRYSGHRGHFFLVADGVGGSAVGEVAASLSVETIEEFLLHTLRRFSNLQATEEQNALKELQAALVQADARIFQETDKHPAWRGMGTTLTLAFAVNSRLFVAHAGDSRCYLLSNGGFHQLTQDHTFFAEMVRRGIASAETVRHPYRHIVTNILGGTEPGVRVELHCLDTHADDVLLLCTDGLTEMVPDDRIAAILQEEPEPRRACQRLIAEANQQGGKDNITAIVAHFTRPGL